MPASLPIPEYERVALTGDMPVHGLKTGDIGVVVHRYPDARGYEVEFFSATGATVAVVTVAANQVRPVEETEVLNARRRAG